MKTLMMFFGMLIGMYAQEPDVQEEKPPAAAAEKAPETTVTVIVRMGENMGRPNTVAYHYVEAYISRGKWVLFDPYYIDFGTNRYREAAVGAGRTFYENKKGFMVGEVYYDQTLGPDSKGAKYLVPWTVIQVQLAKKVSWQTSYFPYVPLDDNGTIQHVLERSKVEYSFAHWKVGAGYAGYKFGNGEWQDKPFITVTRKTESLGAYEFWAQHIPRGWQIQLRIFAVVNLGKNK